MKKVRAILLVVIAVVAVVVAVFVLSVKGSTVKVSGTAENYETLTAAALSDYKTNAANTENVYQQQVVAAWGAKDLLTVIARQNSVVIDNQNALLASQAAGLDNQNNVLVLLKALVAVGALVVAAIAVFGVTAAVRRDPTPGQTDHRPIAPTEDAVS